MAMSPEYREKALKDTKESAATLVEDLQHFRDILGLLEPSRGEIRRLANSLRRLLIEQDIIKIAAPRLDKRFMFNVNDVMPIFRALDGEPGTFFYNGGATVFGIDLSNLVKYPLKIAHKAKGHDSKRMIELSVDQFLSQPVLCLNGQWVNRRATIKYIAYIAGEIHAGTSKTQADKKAEPILKELRRTAKCTKDSFKIEFTPIIQGQSQTDDDWQFSYSPDSIDIVLLELLAAIKFIVESDDTKRLESIIHQELGIS